MLKKQNDSTTTNKVTPSIVVKSSHCAQIYIYLCTGVETTEGLLQPKEETDALRTGQNHHDISSAEVWWGQGKGG